MSPIPRALVPDVPVEPSAPTPPGLHEAAVCPAPPLLDIPVGRPLLPLSATDAGIPLPPLPPLVAVPLQALVPPEPPMMTPVFTHPLSSVPFCPSALAGVITCACAA